MTGGLPATARRGGGAPFVVEADEYAGNFDPYRPAIAIVTSAEWDHPDVFADRLAVVAAFDAWIRQMSEQAVVVINIADAGAAELAGRLRDWPGRLVAMDSRADVNSDLRLRISDLWLPVQRKHFQIARFVK